MREPLARPEFGDFATSSDTCGDAPLHPALLPFGILGFESGVDPLPPKRWASAFLVPTCEISCRNQGIGRRAHEGSGRADLLLIKTRLATCTLVALSSCALRCWKLATKNSFPPRGPTCFRRAIRLSLILPLSVLLTGRPYRTSANTLSISSLQVPHFGFARSM